MLLGGKHKFSVIPQTTKILIRDFCCFVQIFYISTDNNEETMDSLSDVVYMQAGFSLHQLKGFSLLKTVSDFYRHQPLTTAKDPTVKDTPIIIFGQLDFFNFM